MGGPHQCQSTFPVDHFLSCLSRSTFSSNKYCSIIVKDSIWLPSPRKREYHRETRTKLQLRMGTEARIVIILMKINSRMLPRLNLCYLQRKAFEKHRSQVCRIKSSLTAHDKLATHDRNNSLLAKNKPPRMPRLALEGHNNNPSHQSSPFEKRRNRQTKAQNCRLFQAIRDCPPTISHRHFQEHSRRCLQEGQRLLRFQTDPCSQQLVLKNRLSLQKIATKQRLKQSQIPSRLLKGSLPSLGNPGLDSFSLSVQPPKSKSFCHSSKKESQSPGNRQDRQKRLIHRNLGKVQHHFQDRNFSLMAEQKLKGFQQKSQSTNRMHTPQIHKWKTRCFTTQLKSYK